MLYLHFFFQRVRWVTWNSTITLICKVIRIALVIRPLRSTVVDLCMHGKHGQLPWSAFFWAWHKIRSYNSCVIHPKAFLWLICTLWCKWPSCDSVNLGTLTVVGRKKEHYENIKSHSQWRTKELYASQKLLTIRCLYINNFIGLSTKAHQLRDNGHTLI